MSSDLLSSSGMIAPPGWVGGGGLALDASPPWGSHPGGLGRALSTRYALPGLWTACTLTAPSLDRALGHLLPRIWPGVAIAGAKVGGKGRLKLELTLLVLSRARA